MRPHIQAAIAEYVALANRHVLNPLLLAVRCFDAALLSATTLEQLQGNLDSLTLDLDETLLASLSSP